MSYEDNIETSFPSSNLKPIDLSDKPQSDNVSSDSALEPTPMGDVWSSEFLQGSEQVVEATSSSSSEHSSGENVNHEADRESLCSSFSESSRLPLLDVFNNTASSENVSLAHAPQFDSRSATSISVAHPSPARFQREISRSMGELESETNYSDHSDVGLASAPSTYNSHLLDTKPLLVLSDSISDLNASHVPFPTCQPTAPVVLYHPSAVPHVYPAAILNPLLIHGHLIIWFSIGSDINLRTSKDDPYFSFENIKCNYLILFLTYSRNSTLQSYEKAIFCSKRFATL